MSNMKLTALEIVELMIRDRMISKKSAEEFVKILFSTIEDALIDGDSVKVQGLGTFKSQWNEARKSVDVNTGEDIIIDGFYKVTFVPENELKELVNEPFSHLEPVVLEPLSADDSVSEETTLAEPNDEELPVNESSTAVEAPEPLRVFEEQAEEIKGLLSEINALSTKKNEPVAEVDEDKQVIVVPEQTHADEFILGAVTQLDDKQTTEIEQKSTEPIEIEKVSKETAFELDDFDIVRDVSARLGAASFVPPVAKTESSDEVEVPVSLEISPDNTKEEIPEVETSEQDILFEDESLENELEVDEIEPENEVDDADDEYDVDEADEEEIDEEESEPSLTPLITNEEKESLAESAEEEIVSDEVSNQVEELEVNSEENTESAKIVEETRPEIETETAIIDKENVSVEKDTSESYTEETETDKSKYLSWLYVFLGIAVAAGVTWYGYNYVKKSLDQRKDKMYLEYLADSTANALKVKQIAESLKQPKDSVDSLGNRIDSLGNRLDTVNLKDDSAKNTAVPATQDKAATTNGEKKTETSTGNVFTTPRKYTEFITTVKMEAGNQLTKFARQYYGHPNFWVYIYEANRNVIKDPNNVPAGSSIKIPKLDPRLINPKSKESINYALKLQAEYLK